MPEDILADARFSHHAVQGVIFIESPALEAAFVQFCSLIPGFDVRLSAIILAGPTVLSAVGIAVPSMVRRRASQQKWRPSFGLSALPPKDGVIGLPARG
jgi:hypothetical protein